MFGVISMCVLATGVMLCSCSYASTDPLLSVLTIHSPALQTELHFSNRTMDAIRAAKIGRFGVLSPHVLVEIVFTLHK